jgi:hypothetical protein
MYSEGVIARRQHQLDRNRREPCRHRLEVTLDNQNAARDTISLTAKAPGPDPRRNPALSHVEQKRNSFRRKREPFAESLVEEQHPSLLIAAVLVAPKRREASERDPACQLYAHIQ